MFSTFRYTLLELVRIPGILVWTLVFPLVLSSVFVMMFSPLDDMATSSPIKVAVVTPPDDIEGQAFQSFLDALSSESDDGDTAFLAITYAPTAEAAEKLINESGPEEGFTGYVQLQEGSPVCHVVGNISPSGMEGLYSSVLVQVMNEYVAKSALVKELLAENPAAVQSPEIMQSLFEPVAATAKVQLTENQPKESVRYYFALLGMVSMFCGSVGLTAVQRLKPNTSALGARRSVGAISHGKVVAATILASWLLCFACLLVTYFFIRFVCKVDFGDRDLLCIGAVAVASLTATGLGCVVSAIPKVPDDGKSGILTGLVCFSALFAGLYGQPTMALADSISQNFPIIELINPATQISQAFYSVMYYDTPLPYLGHLAVLMAMALLFFLLSAQSLRRQRCASL